MANLTKYLNYVNKHVSSAHGKHLSGNWTHDIESSSQDREIIRSLSIVKIKNGINIFR
jgi:hypothetical protein